MEDSRSILKSNDMEEQDNDRVLRKRRVIDSSAEETITSHGVSEGSEKPQPPDDIIRGMSEIHVRKRMERLRLDFVNRVNDQFDDIMSEVIKDLEVINKFECTNALHLGETEKLYSDKSKPLRNGALPEKEFLRRNSVLTDLYEIKHFKAIYNIFIMILLVISLHTVIYDLLHTGSAHLGSKLIMRGFAKFSIVIEIWLVMVASTFVVYIVCNYWANRRINMMPKSYILKIWDYGGLVLFVAYQLALLILPAQMMVWTGLPPVSRVVVLSEQVRMVMKTHAFVRSTVPLVLYKKPHSDDEELKFPGFSKFLYFLFAPTLIYRDTYPRMTEIRWRFVLWHLCEVILVIFNMAFIFERHLIPPFEKFGKEPFDIRSFVLTVYGTSFPSILIFLSGFYCLLHAWMNAAAEVMRFGDRLFYKDWWNSTTYATYYRRWNVVIHDWLYTYIYKDIYEIVTPGNRLIATCTVFFVSAIFHEFIMSFTFGFFFPIMLLQFGVVGFLLVFIVRTGKSWGNVFIWFSLCTGCGVMISLYSMEYFARVNCPKKSDDILDLILPRSFTCF